MEVGKVHGYLFFHDHKNDSAEHRPPDGADAANDRHEQNIDAGLESEYVAGIKESGAPCIDSARDPSKAGGDGVNPELGGVGIDAYVSGGILVLFDRAQRQAELAVGDDRGDENSERHCDDGGVVMLERIERLVFADAITAGALLH